MPDDYKQQLTDRFVELVEYLNRQFHTGRLDGWEGLEMTVPQIKTLVLLELMGPLRMSSIAIRFGRALSATTAVVDRLVDKNLVARRSDRSDRRLVICELTGKGKQAIAEFWRIGHERIQIVSDMLEMGELEVVVQGLELIRKVEEDISSTLESMPNAD